MSFKFGCWFCKEFFSTNEELVNHWTLFCSKICKCKRCNKFWRFSEVYDGENYIVYFNLSNIYLPSVLFNNCTSPPRKKRCFKKLHK